MPLPFLLNPACSPCPATYSCKLETSGVASGSHPPNSNPASTLSQTLLEHTHKTERTEEVQDCGWGLAFHIWYGFIQVCALSSWEIINYHSLAFGLLFFHVSTLTYRSQCMIMCLHAYRGQTSGVDLWKLVTLPLTWSLPRGLGYLASDFQRSACLQSPSTGIPWISYHARQFYLGSRNESGIIMLVGKHLINWAAFCTQFTDLHKGIMNGMYLEAHLWDQVKPQVNVCSIENTVRRCFSLLLRESQLVTLAGSC